LSGGETRGLLDGWTLECAMVSPMVSPLSQHRASQSQIRVCVCQAYLDSNAGRPASATPVRLTVLRQQIQLISDASDSVWNYRYCKFGSFASLQRNWL